MSGDDATTVTSLTRSILRVVPHYNAAEAHADEAAENLQRRVAEAEADADAAAEAAAAAYAAIDNAADAAIAALQEAELYGAPLARRSNLLAKADVAAALRARAQGTWRAARAPDLVDSIFARRNEPWIGVGVGGVDLVTVPLRGLVTVVGGPGSGKSTISAASVIEHHLARDGAAIYMSRELLNDELGARIIGMREGYGWVDVLRGNVSREVIERGLVDLTRLAFIDGDDANVARLEETVRELQHDFRDVPILAVVDYIQIMSMGVDLDLDPRVRVEHVVETLRRSAQRLRFVVLLVSQTSRDGAKALRSGKATGIDTMAAGAESAAIERASYATIAIGQHLDRGDGTANVDLHVGKVRMGAGDLVVPAIYDGRTGRWTIAGDGRPSEAVKAERQASRERSRLATAVLAVLAAATSANAPQTREELRASSGLQRDLARAAIAQLLQRQTLVEVDERGAHARYPRLWTPERATAAGMQIVGAG